MDDGSKNQDQDDQTLKSSPTHSDKYQQRPRYHLQQQQFLPLHQIQQPQYELAQYQQQQQQFFPQMQSYSSFPRAHIQPSIFRHQQNQNQYKAPLGWQHPNQQHYMESLSSVFHQMPLDNIIDTDNDNIGDSLRSLITDPIKMNVNSKTNDQNSKSFSFFFVKFLNYYANYIVYFTL